MRTTARGRHWWDLAVALATIAIALALLSAPWAAPPPPALAAAPMLRICADPNNLPFSNRAKEGFENLDKRGGGVRRRRRNGAGGS